MKGWILYKNSIDSLRAEAYEIHRLIEVAEEMGIDIKVLAPEQFDLVVTRDDRHSILVDGQETALPDFLLPRMGAATTYFALAVIRHLERLGVQTFNTSESIEVVKDKLYSHQILAQSNLPVAKTMLAKFPVDTNRVKQYLGYPVVVKTISGSQGTGVFLCNDQSNLDDLMELVSATNSNVNIILQEFIQSSHGRDLRIITIGGRAVACMQRIACDGSFKANVSRGGRAEPFDITPELEWLSTEVSRLLGLDIAGIDLLFDGDHYRICEANSSPGFQGMESCIPVGMPHEIFSFIAVRLGKMEYLSKASRQVAANRKTNKITKTANSPTATKPINVTTNTSSEASEDAA